MTNTAFDWQIAVFLRAFHVRFSFSLRLVLHLFCDFIIAIFWSGPVVISAFQAKENTAYGSCEYTDKSNKPRL